MLYLVSFIALYNRIWKYELPVAYVSAQEEAACISCSGFLDLARRCPRPPTLSLYDSLCESLSLSLSPLLSLSWGAQR